MDVSLFPRPKNRLQRIIIMTALDRRVHNAEWPMEDIRFMVAWSIHGYHPEMMKTRRV